MTASTCALSWPTGTATALASPGRPWPLAWARRTCARASGRAADTRRRRAPGGGGRSVGVRRWETVTLEVKGRRTGAVRSAVVTWVEHEGTRYLVSPRGESEWVRNVRAAGGEAAIRRRGGRRGRLGELPAEQRGPGLKAHPGE